MKQLHSIFEDASSNLTLPKVVDFFSNANTVSVAIFSADRASQSVFTNLKAQFNATSFLNSKNLAYFKVRGFGQEISEEGQYTIVTERSYLVIRISLTDVIHLCQEFAQDFFIYAGPETGGKISLYSMASKLPVQTWSKVVAGSNPDGYTVLKDGTTFHFSA